MDASPLRLLSAGAADMGVDLDHDAIGRFEIYLGLLKLWGGKINLTARLDAEEIVVYHFLDSLAGVPLLEESPGCRVVDLGAGAGLPAFPLKFALPALRLLLVDSVRKKVAFCQEVVRATGIADVTVSWGRGEDIGMLPEHHRQFDWAVSRALGAAADVAALALPFLAPGGRVLLYKAKPDAGELHDLDAFCKRRGAVHHVRPVSVPGLSASRCLITLAFPGSRCDAPQTRPFGTGRVL